MVNTVKFHAGVIGNTRRCKPRYWRYYDYDIWGVACETVLHKEPDGVTRSLAIWSPFNLTKRMSTGPGGQRSPLPTPYINNQVIWLGKQGPEIIIIITTMQYRRLSLTGPYDEFQPWLIASQHYIVVYGWPKELSNVDSVHAQCFIYFMFGSILYVCLSAVCENIYAFKNLLFKNKSVLKRRTYYVCENNYAFQNVSKRMLYELGIYRT